MVKIKDIPKVDRPREKLIKSGPKFLKDHELLAVLLSTGTEGKNVLEIGCGGAQCGIAMAKQGAKVTGVDISEEQLKFAKVLAEKNKVKINKNTSSHSQNGYRPRPNAFKTA